MMSESVMKPGRAGVLEEMGRTRDTIFHQLNHPDSGVKPDNLVVFFLNHLVGINAKAWSWDRGNQYFSFCLIWLSEINKYVTFQINGRGSMQYYNMYSLFEQVLNWFAWNY